ncbi:hypothetical protein GCM10011613_27940 [Cellvibrio zantedeschiae]|uniref:DUF72 domain-containing protein n=1 Tax=Cellvibrio zantedeschiae TaxID=1237077 RepID=A0ABQ3B9A0_9GAMM|nr:DUF72 domain-containing protein [Cellvibrio zantedeschiae]GGY81672.1 hypothetical protein GCM10011613_27940 [Cellvibrio zantedeschiae]
MQDTLFGEPEDSSESSSHKNSSTKIASSKSVKKSSTLVEPLEFPPELFTLAKTLSPNLRLGTSSWSCPGWNGIVWDGDYSESTLSRYGLTAYHKHPLFRTVSVDRSFYQPMNVMQFGAYASQVDDNFRFMVKAPSLVTDALVRDESGRGMRTNNRFLNADDALQMFVEPALEGLGHKLGALVFQISPLPNMWLMRMPEMINRLHHLLKSIPDFRHRAPDGVVAVEVRDREWLTPQFVQALRDTRTTYCMGLHAKMPPIDEQLPILRALWPGPLVCRWNLNPVHGAYGYEDAAEIYSPYNKIVDPDVQTREELAKVISKIAGAGQNVYVSLSNKAEGSAPLSVVELSKAINNYSVGKDS